MSYRAAAIQLGPFALTAVTAWVAALVGARVDWTQYGLSVGLLAAAWYYGVWAGFRDQMRAGTVIGSLGFLAALGLMRNATGGSTSGVSIVSLLPIFQTALHVRDRRALWIMLAALAGFYLAPLLIVGPPLYPHSGYRSALLAVAVSSIVGLVTHGLVANIRRRAVEARGRERTLVRVNEAVERLFESPETRAAACAAIKEISGAVLVVLLEVAPGSTTLGCTAHTFGEIAAATDVPVAPDSPAYEAFASHRAVPVTNDVEARVGSPEIWRAAGRPASLLYQPLLRRDTALGVLIVGWEDVIAAAEQRTSVVSLMARQVGVVIDRADVIDQLTDAAHTDPLTGLPNRRAWDAQLQRALADEHATAAVAMLDIDRFKQFNDANGHPAGDSLLREAATAWRSEMRGGDFLARLGGEEFALLLRGADVTTVQAMVERLRAHMPRAQTCSAGIAVRAGGDTAETLLSRADQALYEAKTRGRDRTIFTDSATSS